MKIPPFMCEGGSAASCRLPSANSSMLTLFPHSLASLERGIKWLRDGSAFAELHRLWCSKLGKSIPRLIVDDQTLRHRVISCFGKE